MHTSKIINIITIIMILIETSKSTSMLGIHIKGAMQLISDHDHYVKIVTYLKGTMWSAMINLCKIGLKLPNYCSFEAQHKNSILAV